MFVLCFLSLVFVSEGFSNIVWIFREHLVWRCLWHGVCLFCCTLILLYVSQNGQRSYDFLKSSELFSYKTKCLKTTVLCCETKITFRGATTPCVTVAGVDTLYVILHSLSVLCTHVPVFPLGSVTEIWPWLPCGHHLVSHVLWNHGACPHTPPPATLTCISLLLITVSSPFLCLCLMGSPCFGSIADVVQSHGGVFMDSSYPSSPVTGPLSRGQRRASEVSIASQVSGMADSYTATNIANSKWSPYQKASLSLSRSPTHTNSSPVILPLSAFFQLSTPVLWLYTHPALQLEQPACSFSHSSLASRRPRISVSSISWRKSLFELVES